MFFLVAIDHVVSLLSLSFSPHPPTPLSLYSHSRSPSLSPSLPVFLSLSLSLSVFLHSLSLLRTNVTTTPPLSPLNAAGVPKAPATAAHWILLTDAAMYVVETRELGAVAEGKRPAARGAFRLSICSWGRVRPARCPKHLFLSPVGCRRGRCRCYFVGFWCHRLLDGPLRTEKVLLSAQT